MSHAPGLTPERLGSPSGPPGSRPVRRRNRVINSCLECRRRKLKCNREHPCSACTKQNRKCVFLDGALDSIGLHKLTEIKNRVGSLEDLLETEVAARSQRHSSEDSSTLLGRDSGANSPHHGGAPQIKLEDMNLNVLATPDANYDNDADDDISDIGLQIGMLRISERIGGLFRPQITKELSRVLPGDENPTFRFSPSPSLASPDHSERILPSLGLLNPSWTPRAPSTPPLFVPSKSEAHLLYFQYFACVDPIIHIIHKPSFDLLYHRFWSDLLHGVRPAPSTSALVYAMFFSAVVSLPQQVAQLQFGLDKLELVEKFRAAVEHALAAANFLRATKLETLQAFTIYLIPQCRAEISRSHSSLVGALIRLAESISLHRDDDGISSGYTPLEKHVRRLLWHHICFLDMKTSEIHGPRPTIREDEYDTKLPLNVDDSDFSSSDQGPTPVRGWTSATFSIIRFECYSGHRLIFREREKPTMSLSQLRDALQERKKRVEDDYLRYLDEHVPVQRCALLAARLLIGRFEPMMLARFVKGDLSDTHDELKTTLIDASLKVMECGRRLETAPELIPWAWYAGAYQQYHCILFVILELHHHPESPYAERMWPLLEYVFGSAPELTRREYVHNIILLIKDNLDQFLRLRKVKDVSTTQGDDLHNTRSAQTSLPITEGQFIPRFPVQWRAQGPISQEQQHLHIALQQPQAQSHSQQQPSNNVENWILPGLQGAGHGRGVNVDWVGAPLLAPEPVWYLEVNG